jgi:hypothetical protein
MAFQNRLLTKRADGNKQTYELKFELIPGTLDYRSKRPTREKITYGDSRDKPSKQVDLVVELTSEQVKKVYASFEDMNKYFSGRLLKLPFGMNYVSSYPELIPSQQTPNCSSYNDFITKVTKLIDGGRARDYLEIEEDEEDDMRAELELMGMREYKQARRYTYFKRDGWCFEQASKSYRKSNPPIDTIGIAPGGYWVAPQKEMFSPRRGLVTLKRWLKARPLQLIDSNPDTD